MFRLLDPAAFEACFARYVAALAERIQGVVAVDGKSARRSFDRQSGQGPLHLISAFACDTRLALGQRKVDGKSNEITALPELLALLTLDGCSRGVRGPRGPTRRDRRRHACRKATAEAILERGGDYVLAVKGNQKTLLEDIQLLLDDPEAVPDDVAQTVDSDHGRIKTRRAAVVHDVAWLAERHGFPGLAAAGKIEPRARATARRLPCEAIENALQRSSPLPSERYRLRERRWTAAGVPAAADTG